MDWSDRLLWLAIGCAIGYIIRTLQDIKKEVHEVDTIVKHEKDDAGLVRFPVILDVLLVVIAVLTVFSVVRVEQSYDKSDQAIKDTQAQNARIEAVAKCTLSFTSQTIRALNERTEFTQASANANSQVLREQAKFLRVVLIIPPVSDDESRAALESYFDKLRRYNRVAALQKQQVAENPYPTNEELARCLRVEVDKTKEKS